MKVQYLYNIEEAEQKLFALGSRINAIRDREYYCAYIINTLNLSSKNELRIRDIMDMPKGRLESLEAQRDVFKKYLC